MAKQGNLNTSGQQHEFVTPEQMDFLQKLMYGIVVVVFLGFIGLLVAVLAIYVQWLNFNWVNQSQLTNSIQQLNNDVNCLRWSINSGEATKSALQKCN